MSDRTHQDTANHIAIIGMAGRFPGARDLDEFWSNLRDGVESISVFSDQELKDAGVDASLIGQPNYVKAKGVLDDAELFDAGFFGVNPREADILDPQQRVFLECAWETFESAGHDPGSFGGPIGVFAGLSLNSYAYSNLLQNAPLVEQVGAFQLMLGNDKDFLPTRVSYKLDLKGPSVLVQSACSTSLVAVQFACQSLLDYQSDMALAGGVSITFPRKSGYLYQEGMILSPDGHCRAFDAKAMGTLGGEGVGVVLLKRLEDALEDGDPIRAVILGGAVNNDGSGKVGYTAPSVDGQAEVIAMAHAVSDVDPATISYVETHGTGTKLGDPIEIAGLTQAFRMGTDETGFCAIGSLKTNVGHLDAAAGVASLIKTVLALEHEQIPPSLHFESPNPEIDFETSPFFVNSALSDWKVGQGPRRAAVSSFGIGGTNAHVVLQEAPPRRPEAADVRSQHLFLLSAMNESSLETAAADLLEHVRDHPELDPADVAYTLQVGRRHFAQRKFVVGGDLEEVSDLLASGQFKRTWSGKTESDAKQVAFLFTGQGAQYVNMARAIYDEFGTFRDQLDDCARVLEEQLGLDIRKVLYPSSGPSADAAERLKQTGMAQPALFAIEYSLARLWMDWGVQPRAMLGHSVGEYVAACLAGVFSLEDALRLIAERGRLMQALPAGRMLAVPMEEQEILPYLGDDLSLAAVNGPGLCVVAGPEHATRLLRQELARRDVETNLLQTSHAFHSAMMDPIIGSFTAEVARVELQAPRIPILSNVTGIYLTDSEAVDPAYWGRHLRQTVRFADAVSSLIEDDGLALLEVGPGNTLASLARQQAGSAGRCILSSLRHPRDESPDCAVLMETLGRLWLTGVPLDWQGLHATQTRRRVQLPTYPFQRERHVIEPHVSQMARPSRSVQDLEKNPDIGDWFYVPSWRRTARLSSAVAFEANQLWLVFVDDEGFGEELVQRLRSDGQKVITVQVGSAFSRTDDGNFFIDAGSNDDYERLVDNLASNDQVPDRVLHLWNLSSSSASTSEEALRDRGFYSLVFLAKALARRRDEAPLRIDVVSNQTQNVDGTETLSADKSTILGPSLVIRQEHPQMCCRNIDVEVTSLDDRSRQSLISGLVAEMKAKAIEQSIALRRGQRWVRDVDRVHIDNAARNGTSALTSLREGGVYLITGGLGAIGASLAGYLAGIAGAKLVLTGRSELPPRDAWPSLLDGADLDPGLRSKMESVERLEAKGAQVLVLSADVADERAMRELLDSIDATFGALHGVIHAAGLVGPESLTPIAELDRPRCESQFRPKVAGLRVLAHVLADRPLDFCVVTSSLSSHLGGFGFAAYAAANAFMDAFAYEQDRWGEVPWTAINWEGWQEDEAAAELGGTHALAMTPDEGVQSFARMLTRPDLRNLIVSTGDLRARIAQWTHIRPQSDKRESGNRPDAKQHARPNVSSTFKAPDSDAEQAIAKIWQELLGIERIGADDNFFELGGDSLLATRVVPRLREAFQIEIPLRELFEEATVAALAGRIEDILIGQIEALSEDEVESQFELRSPLAGAEND